jgi:molecular chaperone GrpE
MTDEMKKPDAQELTGDGLGDAPGTDSASAAAAGAEPAETEGNTTGGAEATQADFAQELAQAQEQITELNDRLLRAHADFENYRRRMQREKEETAVYANQKLLLNLLPVLDNLERALGAPAVTGDEKFRQGVELTARSFREILAREGLTPIEAVGQPFDPNFHEAVMTVEAADQEDGTIVAEFQKGYQLGDRVIRPSMVQVTKRSGYEEAHT